MPPERVWEKPTGTHRFAAGMVARGNGCGPRHKAEGRIHSDRAERCAERHAGRSGGPPMRRDDPPRDGNPGT